MKKSENNASIELTSFELLLSDSLPWIFSSPFPYSGTTSVKGPSPKVPEQGARKIQGPWAASAKDPKHKAAHEDKAGQRQGQEGNNQALHLDEAVWRQNHQPRANGQDKAGGQPETNPSPGLPREGHITSGWP